MLACANLHHYISSFEPSYSTALLPLSCAPPPLCFLQLGFQEVGRAAGTPSVYVLAGHTAETQFENKDDMLHTDVPKNII